MTTTARTRTRARLEVVLSGLLGLAALATALWPTWIESLSGLEPDRGSGEAEWWLVVLLGAAALAVGRRARRDLRTSRSPATGSPPGR